MKPIEKLDPKPQPGLAALFAGLARQVPDQVRFCVLCQEDQTYQFVTELGDYDLFQCRRCGRQVPVRRGP